MKLKRKIAYLIAFEKFADNPLLESQVFDLLLTLKKQHKCFEFDMVVVISIHSFLKNVFKILKKVIQLKFKGLRCNFVICFSRVKSIYMPPKQLIALREQVVYKLRRLLRKKKVDLIHCRSYVAQDFAVEAQFCRTVFDLRSSYLDECLFLNIFSRDSDDHIWWLEREKLILNQANQVVVVSEPFVEEVRKKCSTVCPVLIPIICNRERFFALDCEKTKIRKQLDINKYFVFIYVAQMSRWHQLELVVESYKKFKSVMKVDTKLIIVGQESSKVPKNLFSEDIIYIPPVRHEKIPYFYKAANAGFVIHPPNTSESKNVLSVKFTEYCAAGVIPIVNNECGGAVELVKKYGCGVIIDLFDEKSIKSSAEKVWSNQAELCCKALKIAEEKFDLCKVATQYSELYKNSLEK